MPLSPQDMDRKIDEHFALEAADNVDGVLATLAPGGYGKLRHGHLVNHVLSWLVAPIEHEGVERGGQRRGRRQFADGMRRYLRVVREHTGVVEQFLPVDSRINYALQSDVKEFKGLAMIAAQKFFQPLHNEPPARTIGNFRAGAIGLDSPRLRRRMMREVTNSVARM